MTSPNALPDRPGATDCVAVLGGSFDPVHSGHVALARYFSTWLQPDLLRIIPAGDPWQKDGLEAGTADRLAMTALAFSAMPVPTVIDEQEIRRGGATYTIDTLKSLRAELGERTSIAFLMGADQLSHLNTWQGWRDLFQFAHICVASRPGFTSTLSQIPAEVAQEFTRRSGTAAQMRQTPAGLTSIATNLAVNISATEIRQALHKQSPGHEVRALLPDTVLDYIQQHHLYSK